MKCPVCDAELHWDSDVSYEDRGMEGDGIVSFMHCESCGCDIELYQPEINPYAKIKASEGHKNGSEESS